MKLLFALSASLLSLLSVTQAATYDAMCPEGFEHFNRFYCASFCAPDRYKWALSCFEKCPDDMFSTGVGCMRNAHIFINDNSDCPWYDKCGLFKAKGCTKCPEGYRNDGCTCRRDVRSIIKQSNVRRLRKHICKPGDVLILGEGRADKCFDCAADPSHWRCD